MAMAIFWLTTTTTIIILWVLSHSEPIELFWIIFVNISMPLWAAHAFPLLLPISDLQQSSSSSSSKLHDFFPVSESRLINIFSLCKHIYWFFSFCLSYLDWVRSGFMIQTDSEFSHHHPRRGPQPSIFWEKWWRAGQLPRRRQQWRSRAT